MEYDSFIKEWDKYNSWESKNDGIFGASKDDKVVRLGSYAPDTIVFGESSKVNSPAHYTGGSVEAIEVIEDAIKYAPDNKSGYLQSQVLKYMLRLWLKDNDKEDAEKARWYLDRLIKHLS